MRDPRAVLDRYLRREHPTLMLDDVVDEWSTQPDVVVFAALDSLSRARPNVDDRRRWRAVVDETLGAADPVLLAAAAGAVAAAEVLFGTRPWAEPATTAPEVLSRLEVVEPVVAAKRASVEAREEFQLWLGLQDVAVWAGAVAAVVALGKVGVVDARMVAAFLGAVDTVPDRT